MTCWVNKWQICVSKRCLAEDIWDYTEFIIRKNSRYFWEEKVGMKCRKFFVLEARLGQGWELSPPTNIVRVPILVAYQQAPAGGEMEWRKGNKREMPLPIPLLRLSTLYSGQYKERITFFTPALGIWKGRDYTGWSVWEVGEICIVVCERTSTKLKG